MAKAKKPEGYTPAHEADELKIAIVRFKDSVPVSSANEMVQYVYVGQIVQGKPVQAEFFGHFIKITTNKVDLVPMSNVAGVRLADELG